MVLIKAIDKQQIKTINYEGLEANDIATLNKVLVNILIENSNFYLNDVYTQGENNEDVNIELIKEYTKNYFEINLQKIKNLFTANKEDYNIIKFTGSGNNNSTRNSNNNMNVTSSINDTNTIEDRLNGTKTINNTKTWSKTGTEQRALNNSEKFDKGQYGVTYPSSNDDIYPMEYDKQTSTGSDNLTHNITIRDSDENRDSLDHTKNVSITKKKSGTNETTNRWESTNEDRRSYNNTQQDLTKYIVNVNDIAKNTLFTTWIKKLIMSWYWMENV